MKLFYSLLLVSFFSFSQKQVNETQKKYLDTIAKWDFKINFTDIPINKSIRPIAIISFFRKEHILIISSDKKLKKKWTPNINFNIYTISDIDKCKLESNNIKTLSDCISSNIGGDFYIIGNYILLNEQACLNCIIPNSEIDICRPVIEYFLSNIIISNDSSFLDIENQIRLKLNLSN